MNAFTNAASYKFVPLTDLKMLKERFLERSKVLKIKGTVLLSQEGINLFVAGKDAELKTFLDEIRSVAGLENLAFKLSPSEGQPFNRMLVRIKKEIIAFGVETIRPSQYTSPRVAPRQLKEWLDAGEPITLLDTRNDYEIKLGTFENALVPGISHFRDFPEKVKALPPELKEKPLVLFCTGGIRCEKAAPYMESQGFKKIFQLDGGILKYFEECGNAHYQGDCFVFDKRVGLDPTLHESSHTQCYACLSPLTEIEQKDIRYVKGETCPYCYKTDKDKMRISIEKREKIIQELVEHLPGKEPYEQRRPVIVHLKYDGLNIVDFLCQILKHIPEQYWREEIDLGRFVDSKEQVLNQQHKVKAGDRYFHLSPLTNEPDVNAKIQILYEDETLAILNKPAPLPVHPCGRFNRNTLQMFLEKIYAPQKPHPAHRLDANTTGIMLVARTRHFARLLQPQFETGSVEKRYLAKVHGHPKTDSFDCSLPLSEDTLEAGARFAHATGLSAYTKFKVRSRSSEGTSLLEVTPITGRTNQIRIHLWELGFPIVGDPLYQPEKKLGSKQTLSVDEPVMCLHAERLTFEHPISRKKMSFEAPCRAFHWGFSLME